MNAPAHSLAILLFRARTEKYFYDFFSFCFICFTAAAAVASSQLAVGRGSGQWALCLPEKLLAILIPFDRVEGPIAHLIAAEQFGLLGDIDNARDGEVRQMQCLDGLYGCNGKCIQLLRLFINRAVDNSSYF